MAITLDGTSGISTPALSIDSNSLEPLVLATAQTASGTSVDFTGIPSWVKRITVLFRGVSTTGTSDVIVQVGTDTGFITTGYAGSAFTIVGSASPGATAYSTGVLIRLGGAATAPATREGTVVLALIDGNTWIGAVNIGLSNSVYIAGGSGSITLASALNSIRVTTVNGTDTFDAGTINILYE